MIDLLRIIVLIIVVGLCIVCLTSMDKRTSEWEGWAFILICVGSFCRLVYLCDTWSATSEPSIDALAGLLVGLGLVSFCTHTLLGRGYHKRRASDADAEERRVA